MVFLRCCTTTIVCRLRVLSGVNLRRKFCSTDDYLNDINSQRSEAALSFEESNFTSFESANRGAIKKVQSMMNRYYQNPTVETSNAEVIGVFEYYNSEDSGIGNHPNLYRRYRSVSSAVIGRIQSRAIVPEKGYLVLDIDNLLDAVPNLVSLSRMKPSMDHNLIAFSVELEIKDHDEWVDLEGQVQDEGSYHYKSAFFVKDLLSNIICRVDIAAALGINANSSFIPSVVDFEWAVSTTGSPVLYVVLDDNLVRPSRVMFLNIGDLNKKMFPSNPDRIIEETLVRDFAVPLRMLYEVVTETDTAFNIDIGRSKDDKFIIISHQSKVSSEVSLITIPVSIDLAEGEDFLFNVHQPVVLTSRQKDLKYYVDHAKGHFIVATNKPYHPPSVSPPSSSQSSSSSSFYSSMFSSTSPPLSSPVEIIETAETEITVREVSKDKDKFKHQNVTNDNIATDDDLCIIRCSSLTALKQPQQAPLSSFRRRGRKEEKPHPFAHWDIIYPNGSGSCPKKTDTDVGKKIISRVINDFDIFKDKLIIYGRTDGLSSVHMVDLKKSKDPKKSLMESSPGSASLEVTDFTPFIKAAVGSHIFQIIPGCNGAFDTPEVKFCVSNPLTPEMHFAVDLKSGVPRKIVETPGRGKKKVDPIKKVLEKYSIITETAVSDDGTELPVTIVFKKCLSKGITHIPTAKPVPTQVPIPIDSNSSSAHVSAERERPETVPGPLVLIGYGSYGVSIPVGFDPQIIALLERGFTVAYAHCRGGGEYGATWHEQGKGLKKRNTFTDYITIAEYLIQQGYTLPALLCGLGSSAGGLIMGVIANEAPHLFAALIMRHSFLDPYNTMQRSDLPLTVHEYDEFGNPADPLTLKNILSYSPCENIKNHSYPAMFVSTGDMDQKVGPWESLKWVTRVREMQKMRRLQFDQLSDMQSQPSSPLGPWSGSGSGSESSMENDRKVIDQDLGSLSRMDSNDIRHDINIDIESASIPPDSHIDPHSPPTLPFVHSVDGEKEAIEGKTGGGGGGNQYSERLIVFSMTPNAGHDGSSDPTQMMYLQAAEIVFLENAIKKNV